MAEIPDYIHYFDLSSEREQVYEWAGAYYKEPWVSYTRQDDMVNYNTDTHIILSQYTNPDMLQRLIDKEIIPAGTTSLTAEEAAQITSLPTYCFSKFAGSLKQLKYFTGLTTLPNYFSYPQGTQNYVTDIEYPPTLTSIGTYQLWDQAYINTLVLPSITTISGQFFGQCRRLRYLTIPATVTSIGAQSFQRTGWAGYNTGYPNTATNWGSDDYAGITVFCYPTTPPTMHTNNNIFVYSSYNFQSYMQARTAIFVPDESVNTYKTATWWSTYADFIRPMSDKANAPTYNRT